MSGAGPIAVVRTRLELGAATPPRRAPVRRPARVAQMLALAHRIEARIASGELTDRAHAARVFGLTRARVTQLCDLTLLAPEIQEHLLFLEAVDGGAEPLSERALRPLARERLWCAQRRLWRQLQG